VLGAEVNYAVRVSDEEIIGHQSPTPQLPWLDHPCILFFDEALAFLPLDGIALVIDLDVSKAQHGLQ